MDTVLEQQRRLHEERERLEDAMVREFLHKKSTVSILNFNAFTNYFLFMIYFFRIEK